MKLSRINEKVLVHHELPDVRQISPPNIRKFSPAVRRHPLACLSHDHQRSHFRVGSHAIR